MNWVLVVCYLLSIHPLYTSQPAGQDPFVTFIIPSLGRRSLSYALRSLQNQTRPNWRALVLFDGLEAEDDCHIPRNLLLSVEDRSDARITFHNLPRRTGVSNCGGLVRNFGLSLATTPWVAFLDDDDTLSPKYVELLIQLARDDTELVIFRLYTPKRRMVRPPLHAKDIEIGQVGISFAMHHNRSDPARRFYPSVAEDFDILHRLCHFHVKCLIAPYVTYLVNGHPAPLEQGNLVQVPRWSRTPSKTFEIERALRGLRLRCHDTAGPSRSSLPFVFTEEVSTEYGAAIQGLQASLQQAMQMGCVNIPWKFHIIFRPETSPVKSAFIQLHLGPIPHILYKEYSNKLRRATQIWVPTPLHAHYLMASAPHLQPALFSVPTFMYQSTSAPFFQCDKVSSITGDACVYHNGCSARWIYTGNADAPTRRNAQDYQCGSVACEKADMVSTPTVLLYSRNTSNATQFVAACEALRLIHLSTLCLLSASQAVLTLHVCRAKVVVVPQEMFVDTFLLDSLLLAGKVLIALPSGDAETDQFYQRFLFPAQLETLGSLATDLVSQWEDVAKVQQGQTKYFQELTMNPDALCYATRSLMLNFQ